MASSRPVPTFIICTTGISSATMAKPHCHWIDCSERSEMDCRKVQARHFRKNIKLENDSIIALQVCANERFALVLAGNGCATGSPGSFLYSSHPGMCRTRG